METVWTAGDYVRFYWPTLNVHVLKALYITPHGFVHEPPVLMVRAQTIKCHFYSECPTNDT